MAHSLFGERSVTAGLTFNPVRGVARWIKNAAANRRRTIAMRALSELEPHLLHDLGITRADISEVQRCTGAQSPGMVLSAARARSARL